MGKGETKGVLEKKRLRLHDKYVLVEGRLPVSAFTKREEKWEYPECFVLSLPAPYKCSWKLALCHVSVCFWFAVL